MGTRERILDASLTLFNEQGTAAISALSIATALGISPGNLYYHFRGKEEILAALLSECDLALNRLYRRMDAELCSAEDFEPFLLSLLRVGRHFRCLFRDQEVLRFAHPGLAQTWRRLLRQLRQTSQQLLQRLDRLSPLQLNQHERDQLADSLMLSALASLCFELEPDNDGEAQLLHSAATLFALLRPHLPETSISPAPAPHGQCGGR
ncbi:TetR/AcrR family transcriptional regulator [Ferrimonas balearica]|uniref:TetR/AcrR family transcriptional regulator n=1 Tax=Ferrimonas balearica TaxID=44012 RepID=UPI001C95C1E9|nr:TetR/AcrR family transcriptional regulator [Ferrimonas balearica]MBY6107432.1 TetR/AcrR family transcriptional regulator [Ferrimonas balearica]